MRIDLTPVLQALLGLIAAVITCLVIPWIKSKTSEQRQEELYAFARVAVYAAEQVFGAGHGKEKLEWVREALEKKGFDVDTDLLIETIESMVYGMNYLPGLPSYTRTEEDEEDEDEDEVSEE